MHSNGISEPRPPFHDRRSAPGRPLALWCGKPILSPVVPPSPLIRGLDRRRCLCEETLSEDSPWCLFLIGWPNIGIDYDRLGPYCPWVAKKIEAERKRWPLPENRRLGQSNAEGRLHSSVMKTAPQIAVKLPVRIWRTKEESHAHRRQENQCPRWKVPEEVSKRSDKDGYSKAKSKQLIKMSCITWPQPIHWCREMTISGIMDERGFWKIIVDIEIEMEG